MEHEKENNYKQKMDEIVFIKFIINNYITL